MVIKVMLSFIVCVLVPLGCNNKTPHTGWLKQQTLFLPVLENGIWDPGVGRAGSSRGLSPGRVDGPLLPVSSRGRPSVCVWVLISSSYKDPTPMGSGPTLMTSSYLYHLFKDPHLQIQSHSEVLGVRGSTREFFFVGRRVTAVQSKMVLLRFFLVLTVCINFLALCLLQREYKNQEY